MYDENNHYQKTVYNRLLSFLPLLRESLLLESATSYLTFDRLHKVSLDPKSSSFKFDLEYSEVALRLALFKKILMPVAFDYDDRLWTRNVERLQSTRQQHSGGNMEKMWYEALIGFGLYSSIDALNEEMSNLMEGYQSISNS